MPGVDTAAPFIAKAVKERPELDLDRHPVRLSPIEHEITAPRKARNQVQKPPWTDAESNTAARMYELGYDVEEIAAKIGRTPKAVRRRMDRMKIRKNARRDK